MAFHWIDHCVTLFGSSITFERHANLEPFYNKMLQVPAVSTRLQERPKAGSGKVGNDGSIINTRKDPSRLEFIQKAWNEKVGTIAN